MVSKEEYGEIQMFVKELKVVWERKEKYWIQRSRVNWIKCGDKNTKFFHQSNLQRRRAIRC